MNITDLKISLRSKSGYHECPGCARANVVNPPPVADRRLLNFSGELQYVCRCGRKNSITFKP
jgi:hypothetical protein